MSHGAVVVTYKRPDLLWRCLSHLRQANVTEGAVWVNGGDRESCDVAEKYGFSWHAVPRNASFAEANNTAVEETDWDEFFLVNNDCMVTRRAIEAMLVHEADVVGTLIADKGGVAHAGVGFQANGTPGHIGRGDDVSAWLRRCEEVPAVTFACAKIKRSTWNRVGGLDENYFYGFEDTDFCLKVQESGGVVEVCRSSAVYHDEKTTRGDKYDEQNGMLFAGKWIATGRIAGALEAYGERIRLAEQRA